MYLINMYRPFIFEKVKKEAEFLKSRGTEDSLTIHVMWITIHKLRITVWL